MHAFIGQILGFLVDVRK